MVANIIAFDLPEEGGFSIVSTRSSRILRANVPEEFVGHKSKAYKKMYSRKDSTMITRQPGDKSSVLRVWKYFKSTSAFCALF